MTTTKGHDDDDNDDASVTHKGHTVFSRKALSWQHLPPAKTECNSACGCAWFEPEEFSWKIYVSAHVYVCLPSSAQP